MSENYLKLFASTTKSLVNIRKQCRTVGQLLGITSKVQYIVQQFWKPLEIHFQMAGNSVKVFEKHLEITGSVQRCRKGKCHRGQNLTSTFLGFVERAGLKNSPDTQEREEGARGGTVFFPLSGSCDPASPPKETVEEPERWQNIHAFSYWIERREAIVEKPLNRRGG